MATNSQPTQSPISANEIATMVTDKIGAMVAYWSRAEICLFANAAYSTWFGRSHEEMIGISLERLLGPLYAKNLPYIREALNGAEQVFEREVPLPDGAIRHALATYTPDVVDGVVRGFVAHVADVTRVKLLEQQLAETTNLFRSAMESMHVGLVIHDRMGTVRLCNNAALTLLELSEHELMGHSIQYPELSLVHADGTPWPGEEHPAAVSLRNGAIYRDVIMGFRSRSEEMKWLRVNSSPVLSVDETGPVGAIATFVDVTQRRRDEAERAIRARRDQRIAEILQEAVLPSLPDAIAPGLTVRSIYSPASDEAAVGGDFYDAFPLPRGAIGLLIGDVMGHGLSAAISISKVRFALHGFLSENPSSDPAEAVERLNYFLTQSNQLRNNWTNRAENAAPGTLVALTLVVINPESGLGRLVTAGMEAPVLVRAATKQAIQISASGMLLGVDPASEYRAVDLALEHGDVLAIATDGITDAYHQSGPLDSQADVLVCALRDAIAQSGSLVDRSLEDLCTEVLGFARSVTAGSFRDDVCLLVARRESTKESDKESN